MRTKEEKVWARVPDDVFASIETIRTDIEKRTGIKPSVSQVVLMLLKLAIHLFYLQQSSPEYGSISGNPSSTCFSITTPSST